MKCPYCGRLIRDNLVCDCCGWIPDNKKKQVMQIDDFD